MYRLRLSARRAESGHAAVPVEDGAITVAVLAAQAVYDSLHRWSPPAPPELEEVIARAKVESADPENTETQGHDYLMDHTTVSIGTIHGGIQANLIADQCEVEIDIRTTLGTTTEMVQARAAEAVRAATEAFAPMTTVELAWEGALEAAYCSPETPLVRELRRNHQVIPTPLHVLGRISAIFSPFSPVFCAFSPSRRGGSNKPQAGAQGQETVARAPKHRFAGRPS